MIGGSNEVYGQVRASVIEQNTYDKALLALRSTEVPSNLQQWLDYDTREDGQPVYIGFADKGLSINASGWLLQNFTYNDAGLMTKRLIAYDSWADRTLTTFE